MNKPEKMKIGNVQLDNPFIFAPMAGITDAPNRRICRRMGAALVYTEMISAKGLYYGDRKTEQLLFMYEEEKPVAIQIFGHEPDIVAFAAKELESRPNAILDINMGCPVPKIVKNGEGSALLKDPDLVYEIIRAMVQNTSKPVTAKIRIGFDENHVNCVDVAKAIDSAGAAAIAVHGRTREQYYSGSADWNRIAAVKKAVSIPVIGNGDVTSVASASALMEQTHCDFVMVGRAALGNPWIFRELTDAWYGHPQKEPVTVQDKKDMMKEHLQALCELKGERAAIREMRKHIGWYVKGLPGSATFRGKINQINDLALLDEAIDKL